MTRTAKPVRIFDSDSFDITPQGWHRMSKKSMLQWLNSEANKRDEILVIEYEKLSGFLVFPDGNLI